MVYRRFRVVNFDTSSGSAATTRLTSSRVLNFERLKRMAPWAIRSSTCMALRTCDGSSDPLLHAEPADAQIPDSLSNSKIAAASSPSKPMFVVL